MAKKRQPRKPKSQAKAPTDPLCLAFYSVGKRIRQFNILTNTEIGVYFCVQVSCPHLDEASRYALSRLGSELDELLRQANASDIIKPQVSSLLHEIRSAWEARTRREFERPDSAILESRVRELEAILQDIAATLGWKRGVVTLWYRFGQQIVSRPRADEGSSPDWSPDYELALQQACRDLNIEINTYARSKDGGDTGWPVLPEEFSYWEEIEAALEQHKEVVRAVQNSEWSRPRSPDEWRRLFNLSWDTLKKQFDQQIIRNKKITTKSYQVHRDHLPESCED